MPGPSLRTVTHLTAISVPCRASPYFPIGSLRRVRGRHSVMNQVQEPLGDLRLYVSRCAHEISTVLIPSGPWVDGRSLCVRRTHVDRNFRPPWVGSLPR
jgi:hypothetical protein